MRFTGYHSPGGATLFCIMNEKLTDVFRVRNKTLLKCA